jgi:hypothetical protein
VEEVTTQIYAVYVSNLPFRTGQLKESADIDIRPGGWGVEQDRWFGYVTNSAPYAAVIEYGSRRRNIAGGHQLRRAAEEISGGIGTAEGVNIPGLTRDRRGRGSTLRGAGGRFVANPITGRRRPN